MKRTLKLVGAAVAGAILISSFALAQEKAKDGGKSDGPTCPVQTGKPIKKDISSKYQDKDVYFCCKMCKAKFDKDPKPFEAGVKAQWAAMKPLAVQVTCPGSGHAVNQKFSVQGDHGPVYFCCADCKAGWEKDSTAMKAKLADCYTYQTECPVMGETIDPKVTVKHNGKTYYLCCNDCVKEFEKDAAKLAAKADELAAKNKAEMEKMHAKPAKP